MNSMFAVVIGASQGLGKSLAQELAKKGFNLILISLPEQNLAELSLSLRHQFKIKVVFKEVDLSIKENVLTIASWINQHYKVNILVNNAGIGGTKKFEEASSFYIEKIIQLNVLATSLLTHQLLPNLKKQEKAYILNVSSLAALCPLGYKTVYPASKAFIHSFSRGLYQELKNSNVFVSVVNPGAMATNPEVTERIKKQGILGKLTLLDPDKVARRCVRQILRRDTVIIVNPFSWLMLNVLPIWIKLPLMTNAIKKEVQS